MLDPDLLARVDARLADDDLERGRRYPGPPAGRQPVHTVYVPADRFRADTVAAYGRAALRAMDEHGPLPIASVDESAEGPLDELVRAKLAREPVEDLRIDFEDGFGVRPDEVEDAAAVSAAEALRATPVAFCGLRIKSLEAATRRRGLRTLAVFLEALGQPPAGFRVTLPKVTSVAQVEAMAEVCTALDLRFEIQVEMPQAVVGPDGTALVSRMIAAAEGRCAGLHFGTYDYTNSLGIAAAHQALDHPAADHAKAVLQAAAALTGVPVSDGSTNVLPVGTTGQVRHGWEVHARLVRRSLERGFYQGWDLHPAQLPTRFAATYAFFRDGADAARARLADPSLEEPATIAALEGFLRRGRECGAL